MPLIVLSNFGPLSSVSSPTYSDTSPCFFSLHLFDALGFARSIMIILRGLVICSTPALALLVAIMFTAITRSNSRAVVLTL